MNDHLKDFLKVFKQLQYCQLKMNPLKCAFGIFFKNFLGFIVWNFNIEIDQSKTDFAKKKCQNLKKNSCAKKVTKALVIHSSFHV